MKRPSKKTSASVLLLLALALGGVDGLYAADSGHAHGQAATQDQKGQAPPAEEREAPLVEVPDDLQKLIGARTAPAEVRSLRRTVRTVGRVETNEKSLATVNAKFEGWIEKLHINATGMAVKKGEPMAEMYSPELVATQREFLNLVRWSNATSASSSDKTLADMLQRDSEALVEAARDRLRLWDISDEQIKAIEASGKTIRTLTLYSPATGVVIEKPVVQGMRVMPGEKLFDVADLSSLWVIADIYESELADVRPGTPAEITFGALPGKIIRSAVDFIYPTLSGPTRTARARFVISNPGGLIRPQMFAGVALSIDLGKKLSIPDSAVLDTGQRQIVYVDRGEGNFEPRPVVLGASVDGYREVIRGLKAGEKVAISATFLIDSEAQLKGIEPAESR